METKINVSLRIKPLSSKEEFLDKNHLWEKMSDSSILNKRTNEIYQFDKVFGPEVSTREVFDS
jgi:hypothetical protein